MPTDRVKALLATMQQQVIDCHNHPDINGILIFENNGEAVGVSNPHPHCQVYGLASIADFARELVHAMRITVSTAPN